MVIKYIQLFRYLMNREGLSAIEAYRSIGRIRKLPTELKQAVYDVLNSLSPIIEYEGVSYEELVNEDEMSPIRAILMLDWIRREPIAATKYMAKERLRSPLRFATKDTPSKIENGAKDESDITI